MSPSKLKGKPFLHTFSALESAAERALRRVLDVLAVTEKELEALPKGAPEKVALAWWLRDGTTVSLRWVGERLGMGHYTRVTQAISRMKRRPGYKLERIKRKLVKLKDAMNQ